MFICKMTSFVLTFALVCLLDPAVALRSQENLNVLVPNNDVNLQTKIKKLLNDDEVDREDFSENEIEKLSAIKNPKIDKFLGRKANTENKVFDDKNKNIEQNMIDYEPSLLRELSVDNVTSYPTEFSVTPTVPSLFTSNSSSSLTTTESIFFTTRNVTFSTTANNTNGSPIYSTPAVNVSSSLPILTPSSPMPTHNSSTTRQYFPSPPESSLLISTTTEASTTYKPIYNDLQPDECILGKPDKKILWADDEGSLNNNFIETNYGRDVRKADLSRKLITENRTSHEYNVSF